MSGVVLPLPQYSFMAWCSVKKKKHRENFTFTCMMTSESVQTTWYMKENCETGNERDVHFISKVDFNGLLQITLLALR
jgi:hypothetical protein